ncbi:MAG: alpha-E domain-containing protein [Lachnospiraceae bacterium]|jgi:uncharacterized alpha-E superfamily protein
MGALSLDQKDRLYQLGMYTERVFLMCRKFAVCYDKMIETNEEDYEQFCAYLNVVDTFRSRADFIHRYCFDEKNQNSIISSLKKAYDCAYELREIITSEVFSYIQLAVYAMRRAAYTNNPFIEVQRVVDDIAAFWGMAGAVIENEDVRRTIADGREMEKKLQK